MNIIEILDYNFIQRALIVWVLLAIVFAFFGNIVVLRKGANISHTISHFALLWIAGWLFLSINWYISMIIFLLLWIAIIHFLQKRGFFSDDAINEIIAQLWLVWAILFFSYTKWYLGSIEQYLFGDILLITKSDMQIVIIFSILTIILFWLFIKPLLATSFNQKISKVYNIKTEILNFLYILFLAISIWISIKILWVLLVTAFIVLAPNIMKMIAKNTKQMIFGSIILNILAVIWWLIVSYFLKIPSGIGIVAVLLWVFFVVSILNLKKTHR
jgi:zinc transport system permease protein